MSTSAPRFSSPADVRRFEQEHPIESLDLPNSTFELLQRSAQQFNSRPALSFLLTGKPDEAAVTFSYSELLAKVIQTANGFEALGLGSDDVVSMLLPNLPQNQFTLWGGEAAGIVNPINPMLEPDHIAAILQAANSKLLVALAPFPGTDIWHKVEQVRQLVPSLEKVFYVDLCQYLPAAQAEAIRHELPLPSDDWTLDFDQWISQQPGDALTSGRVIAADETAALFHTGGTTGVPKLAPHTHRNEVIDSRMLQLHVGLNEQDCLLCGLPTFHVNGFIVTGTTAYLSGAHVVLATPQGFRNPELLPNFWRLVEKYRITFCSAVPAVYAGLLQVPVGDADISSIKAAFSGGAPLPLEVHKRFEALTGCALIEGYGLTESTCFATANPVLGERRTGSIGFSPPYFKAKVAILDEQGRHIRDADTNEPGTLIIRGPHVFKGYTDPSKNEDIWVQGDWFNTGDLAREDEEGYFWLTGRSKDLIIRGGHNIDPGLIEEALNQHPDVVMAAAVGKPCPRVGELPIAYVTLKPGSDTTEEELLSVCQRAISERAAVPKEIHIVDEIPLTAVGKIFKPSLRLLSTRFVLEHELMELLQPEQFKVAVEASSHHGQAATVFLLDREAVSLRAQVEQRLGCYSVHCEYVESA